MQALQTCFTASLALWSSPIKHHSDICKAKNSASSGKEWALSPRSAYLGGRADGVICMMPVSLIILIKRWSVSWHWASAYQTQAIFSCLQGQASGREEGQGFWRGSSSACSRCRYGKPKAETAGSPKGILAGTLNIKIVRVYLSLSSTSIDFTCQENKLKNTCALFSWISLKIVNT